MIEGRGISHAFGTRVVVDGVTITIDDHGLLGLVGPNGSGKTTLLRTLYGSLVAAAGDVTLDGAPVATLPRKQLARRLAVVVQEQPSGLPMRVADMVMLGRLPHQGLAAVPDADDERIVADALAMVGVTDLARRNFAELSGGERQRVLIARALAQQADHILLDEPTNHLDIRYQHEVLELLTRLPASTAVILHDLNLAARYCSRIVVLDEGRVVAEGTPETVLIPEVLEPVYGVSVRRLDVDGVIHLVFSHQLR